MSGSSELPRLLVVFYANPDLYPPTFNAVSLLSRHFQVRVLCRRSDRETRLWPEGVRLDRVGPGYSKSEANAVSHFEKARELASFVWATRRALTSFRPSVVLAYEAHALVALSLAKNRAPVVYQRHEVEESDQYNLKTLGGQVGKLALKLSRDVSLTVFPEAHRAAHYAALAKLDRAPIIVPNYPLLSSFPAPDLETLLPVREARQHLLYRGALGSANGIREAIRAMPLLDERTKLRLCGPASSEFRNELDALVNRERLSDRVEIAGFIQFDELNRQTQRASLGLMLYQPVDTNWAFIATANNKLYEYAACGVPALVPDRSAFRDALGDQHWVEFVDEQTPSSIADGARRLLDSQHSYRERARTARGAFEGQFNYERVFGPLLERILVLAKDSNSHEKAAS